MSAYHLYGNFGEKFLLNHTGIFLASKTGTGLSCTICKMPVNFSLSLGLKPGTSNPNKWWISVVPVKAGKGNSLKGFTFLRENFHRDEPSHLNSPRNFRVYAVCVSLNVTWRWQISFPTLPSASARYQEQLPFSNIQWSFCGLLLKVTRPSFFLGGGGTILIWSSLESPPLLLS